MGTSKPRAMIQRTVLPMALLLALLLPAQSRAASAAALLGDAILDLRARPAGEVADLIVDVRDSRVLYVVLDRGGRFETLPVRALKENGRIDLDQSGEAATLDRADLRFRRASALIGQQIEHPHPGGVPPLGTVTDFHFHDGSGRIERVAVATPQGERSFGPEVLAQGRFPPLDVPRQEVYREDESGYEMKPSDERMRVHPHDWDR